VSGFVWLLWKARLLRRGAFHKPSEYCWPPPHNAFGRLLVKHFDFDLDWERCV